MPTTYAEQIEVSQVKRYRAAKTILCLNEYGQAPVMKFSEVDRITVSDQLVSETPTGRVLEVSVQAPGIKIPYINPDTYEQILGPDGAPIEGQYFTDEQIAYAVACAYIYAAKQADNAPVFTPPEPQMEYIKP
jgi:hypothetical protein